MNTKKRIWEKFPIQILFNCALILSGVVFFPIGFLFSVIILPIEHSALTYMNVKFAQSRLKLIILQLIMLISTELAILLNWLIYYEFIEYDITYDSEGILLAKFLALCAAVVVITISVCAVAMRKPVWNKKVTSISV